MIRSISWLWILLGLVAAGALMSVLIVTDSSLTALGVPGVASLQAAPDPAGIEAIVTAWREAGAAVLARVGFSLGWDYIFLVANGIVFTLAGLKAREDLFPAPGALRLIVLIAVLLMPLGSALDAVENVFQLQLVAEGADPALALWCSRITAVKWVVVTPCMLVVAAGLLAAAIRGFRRR